MAEKTVQAENKVSKKSPQVIKTNDEMFREKLLNENTAFYVREAYKTLRTKITFSIPSDGCKKFLVTSSLASEGKSTNCVNVAITFAETGSKVCVVDCDLRRPNIHRLFNVSSTPGISNVLVNINTIDEVIRHSKYPNLDYISAGEIPPNPAELLGSEKFKEVVAELEEKYDYLIFDTCPVNVITDTAIIAKVIPEVIVVALQNSTERDSLHDAVSYLEFAGAKILGFILNGVEYNYKGGYKYRYGRKYYRVGGKYTKNPGYLGGYGHKGYAGQKKG